MTSLGGFQALGLGATAAPCSVAAVGRGPAGSDPRLGTHTKDTAAKQ